MGFVSYAVLLFLAGTILFAYVQCRTTYRAAVYEHVVIYPDPWATDRETAVEHMMKNLQVYDHNAMKAAEQGVDIMVFPEDGLYGFYIRNRWSMRHYLEPIPDPRFVEWVPCDDPKRFPLADVQIFLSCMAKRYNMYIAAVMGDLVKCPVKVDPQCPWDGAYQYNTNVVFDRRGQLIAKYHKQNRFYEPQFNAPTHPEYVYFDTDFGRFGVIICNDILFHDPLIELIRDYNVTDLVFPMAWPDSLPLYISVVYFSSFAVGHSVNMLAPNIKYKDGLSSGQGSGIFTPVGPLAYTYEPYTAGGHLIVADVPINFKKSFKIPCDVNPIMFGHPHIKAIAPLKETFKSTMYTDWFTFVPVKGAIGSVTVCNNGFCCYLTYEKHLTHELYALGAFNGLHKGYGPIYQQICIVTKCKTYKTCGGPVAFAFTAFKHFHLKGTFSSPYIQPEILLSGPAPNYPLKPAPIGSFTFGSDGLTGTAVKDKLIQASLLGRVYRKDCLTCLGG